MTRESETNLESVRLTCICGNLQVKEELEWVTKESKGYRCLKLHWVNGSRLRPFKVSESACFSLITSTGVSWEIKGF